MYQSVTEGSENKKYGVLILLTLIGGFFSSLLALSLFFLAFRRSLLDYNEEGRYFDIASGVVYHDSAIAAFWAVGTIALILAATLFLASVFLHRKRGR